MTPEDYNLIKKSLIRFGVVITRWENNYYAIANDKKNLSLSLDALERNK